MDFYQSSLSIIFSSFLIQKSDVPILNISTDSRDITPHSLFIPLIGQNFNGSQFITQAIEKGASAVAVTKEILSQNTPLPTHISIFLVHDTLEFYQQIAKEYLKTKTSLIKIVITGSAGKTSTKEWLFSLLSQKYHVYKTFKNYNNLIGLPLSLLSVQDEDIAIFEIGTGKPGDIAVLTSLIEPDISIITSIGKAHLEYFPSFESIIQEKFSISKFSKKCFISEQVQTYFLEKISNNISVVNTNKLLSVEQNLNEQGYILKHNNYQFTFPFFGEYNISNLSLALTVALDLKIPSSIVEEIEWNALPSFRQKIVSIDNTTVILDCYNANPLSLSNSIKQVAHFKKPTALILGNMLELGVETQILHQQVGEQLNELNFNYIIFIGNYMKYAYEAYKKSTKYYFESIEELEILWSDIIQKNHIIFIKGSRGMYLEKILDYKNH